MTKGRKCPLVLYHADCMDGMAAAWAVWKHRRAEGDTETEYVPVSYDEPPPDVAGRDVLIVDFSYKRPVLEEMAEHALTITILDHHGTAEEALHSFPNAYFDMNRSGAGMAWDYSEIWKGRQTQRPWLIDYVEDRDLWRFALPRSREVSALINSTDRTLEAYDELSQLLLAEAAALGQGCLRRLQSYARNVAQQSYETVWSADDFEMNIHTVNTHFDGVSEVLDEVLRLHPEVPVVMAWFRQRDGKYRYSLRSRNWEDVNVAKLAQSMGGGGHEHAAGFVLDELLLDVR